MNRFLILVTCMLVSCYNDTKSASKSVVEQPFGEEMDINVFKAEENIIIKQHNVKDVEAYLSSQFKQQITDFNIRIEYVEDLLHEGAGPYKLYYRVHETCAIISFIVPEDSRGARYQACYYIPHSFIKQTTNNLSNRYNRFTCYIYDKWLGGNAHSHFNGFAVAKNPETWEEELFFKLFE